MIDYRVKLSKFLSYILRHDPDKYDLELDKNGYTDLGTVLGVLTNRFKNFKKEDLLRLVERDPKGRFEITSGRIRATYGHSIEVQPGPKSVTPPETLYHGTSSESMERILTEGLRPMDRQFVHLSVTRDDAYAVGSRHTDKPVILMIMAKKAHSGGIEFFKGGNLFLVKEVPAEYIEAENK
jgi:putative RNA 2'-phosphotransferase